MDLSHTLERIILIQAVPETVFRFFQESPKWASWWGPGSTIDPVPGGKVYIRHPNGIETIGEVVEILPPERIVFTYGYAGGTPIPPGASRVTIRLRPDPAGTRLRLFHEFSDANVRDQHVQGWRFQLSLFGNVVADEVFGGAVPTEYIPSVEHGFRKACEKGAKYGFPLVDVKATLLDGKAHDVDSSADTFKLAAIESFRDAQMQAGLVILEPIMNVVVLASSQYQGSLAGDINHRRGNILNLSSDKGRCMLHAYIPLAELFGYTSDLRNVTSGTASFSMEPSHYAAVKEELADIRIAS